MPRLVEAVSENYLPLMGLRIGRVVIRTTIEHPFWVEGRGWTPANLLMEGDRLRSHNGSSVVLSGVEYSLGMEPVYNLQIAEYHTYFVGCNEWGFSVWAHNSCFEIRFDPGSRTYTLVRKATGERFLDPTGGSITSLDPDHIRQIAKGWGIDPSDIAQDVVDIGSKVVAPNGGLGPLQKVNKPDAAADALAQRLGGESRVKFANGPDNEFDAVSDLYVAQTKPANFKLGSAFRDQAKTTFETAQKTGRTPYFHFDGPPHPDVLRKLAEYAKRYGIEPIIDTTPL